MTSKTTKRALLSSALSLILCLAMLIGTTFAWFTDSVESGINTIQAGNLDVKLYHTNRVDTHEEVTSTVTLFDDVTLWEPGAMAWEKLSVENAGNLALKYILSVNFANATATPAGKTLADALKVAVLDVEPTRENIKSAEFFSLESFTLASDKELLKGVTDTFYVAIYWVPTANDNDFNMNNGANTVLTIDLGVKLLANQVAHESDSFDKNYDLNASNVVDDLSELQTALDNAAEGATIYLAPGEYYIPGSHINIYKSVSIIGIGDVTIKNNGGWHMFHVSNYYGGANDMTVNIKNIDFDNQNKGKAGIYAKYNVVLNLEDVSVVGSTWDDIQIDNGNPYADGGFLNGTKTVVNATGVKAGKVSVGALPSAIAPQYNNQAHFNFDETCEIGSIKRDIRVGTDFNNEGNLFINEQAGTDFYFNTAAAQAALDNAQPGDVISLANGNFGKLTVKKFWTGDYQTTGIDPITIKSTLGAKVEAVDLNGMNFVTLDGLTFDAAKAIAVYASSGKTAYMGNIVDAGNNDDGNAYKRGAGFITVNNCVFEGTPADITKYSPINFKGSNTSSWTRDITVSYCKFLADSQNFITMDYVASGFVKIENNLFGGDGVESNHHAINATSNGGNWTITGNTFINWKSNKTVFASSRSGIPEDPKSEFIITGNKFYNNHVPGDGDDGILEFKSSYTAANTNVTFENNEFFDALAGLDETTIKWVKPAV